MTDTVYAVPGVSPVIEALVAVTVTGSGTAAPAAAELTRTW